MKLQPELLDPKSPDGLEVYDLAPDVEHAVLTYPDKPTFLQDGRVMLMSVDHQPHLCHLDENGRLEPLAKRLPGMIENRAEGQYDLAPGGRYLVYRATPSSPDQLLLRRLDFQTNQVEDVFELKGSIPGTHLPANKFRMQTVSSDGLHIGGGIYMGDGQTPQAGWGIAIINTQTRTAGVIKVHNDFHNTHLQYSREHQLPGMYDLLVQMNHGAITDKDGKVTKNMGPPSDLGVDVHMIHDDGSNWRDLPFGRDGIEGNIGHQVWRGATNSAVTVTLENLDTSYGWAEGTRQHIIAGRPIAADFDKPHMGKVGRDDLRVDLSKGFKDPRFCHLGVDDSGLRFAFDTFPVFNGPRAGMLIYIARASDMNSPLKFQYILNTGIIFTGGDKGTHAHPILSPGGKELFFNSNMLGKPKAYMVKNLPWPK